MDWDQFRRLGGIVSDNGTLICPNCVQALHYDGYNDDYDEGDYHHTLICRSTTKWDDWCGYHIHIDEIKQCK